MIIYEARRTTSKMIGVLFFSTRSTHLFAFRWTGPRAAVVANRHSCFSCLISIGTTYIFTRSRVIRPKF